MDCSTCGTTVPIRKGVVQDGRSLAKTRECPNCGDPVGGDNPRSLRK